MARATSSAEVAEAYRGEKMSFGRDYLIPKPFDPRLMGVVASTVAKAAIESGVATRLIEDFDAYQESLDNSISKSALLMRPVFDAASKQSRKVVFAETCPSIATASGGAGAPAKAARLTTFRAVTLAA